MAANVVIFELNGASPGVGTNKGTTGGTLRFKKADNSTVDANNPLVQPTAGAFDRSNRKCIHLFISGVAPTGQISNIRCYTDGANGYGTGIDVFITSSGVYTASFVPSSEAGATSIFGFTSGAPYDLDTYLTGPFTGISERCSDFVYLHAMISSSAAAPQNPTNSEIFTLSWDET